MAIKFTSVKCPECGANLPIEEGRERLFCTYCGTQIIITNENEHTYRHVDEAEVKRAETERLVHLKELELEEKENERRRRGRNTAFAIAGTLAIIGTISEIAVPYNSLGIFSIIIAMYIALFALISRKERPGRTRRIISHHEVQVTEDMASCGGKHYQAVVSLFQSAGFSSIKAVGLKDLNLLTARKNGQVDIVSISGKDNFEEGDIFQKSDSVIITYHSTM